MRLIKTALTLGLFTSLAAACAAPSSGDTQQLYFDARYFFDIYTGYPLNEAFPLKPGQHVKVPVVFLSHPVHEAVRQEISPDLTWYASVYPDGQPDPADPFQETLLLPVTAVQAPERTYRFPWRVDHDDLLIGYLEGGEPAGLEAGTLIMEVVLLEKLENVPEQEIRVWHMQLRPVGEVQDGRVLSEVEWRLP